MERRGDGGNGERRGRREERKHGGTEEQRRTEDGLDCSGSLPTKSRVQRQDFAVEAGEAPLVLPNQLRAKVPSRSRGIFSVSRLSSVSSVLGLETLR